MKRKLALVALLASSVMGLAHANDVEAGIAQYREMLQDGNPAELFEMAGEELWTTPTRSQKRHDGKMRPR